MFSLYILILNHTTHRQQFSTVRIFFAWTRLNLNRIKEVKSKCLDFFKKNIYKVLTVPPPPRDIIRQNQRRENMTEEQIRKWAMDELKKNPKLAEEYKAKKLLSLQTELRLQQKKFDRKGYKTYRNLKLSEEIVKLNQEIQELEKMSADELFIDELTRRYSRKISECEDIIKYFENLTEEDRYVAGVFSGTGYWIWHKANYESNTYRSNKKEIKKIKKIEKIYKKGLPKRDEFIKKGAEVHKGVLKWQKTDLQEYTTGIDKHGPSTIKDMIYEEMRDYKYCCKQLAEISVVDAFEQMGADLKPKESGKIDSIIEAHDPVIVEQAIKTLVDKPTKNMLELQKFMSELPSRLEKSSIKKGLSFGVSFLGICLTLIGFVGIIDIINSNIAYTDATVGVFSVMTAIGVVAGSAGAVPGLIGLGDKKYYINKKDDLVSRCLDDLLNEVVRQTTANKAVEL